MHWLAEARAPTALLRHQARLEIAAGLLQDVDGLQVGAALEPQHRVHRQLRKLIFRLGFGVRFRDRVRVRVLLAQARIDICECRRHHGSIGLQPGLQEPMQALDISRRRSTSDACTFSNVLNFQTFALSVLNA